MESSKYSEDCECSEVFFFFFIYLLILKYDMQLKNPKMQLHRLPAPSKSFFLYIKSEQDVVCPFLQGK